MTRTVATLLLGNSLSSETSRTRLNSHRVPYGSHQTIQTTVIRMVSRLLCPDGAKRRLPNSSISLKEPKVLIVLHEPPVSAAIGLRSCVREKTHLLEAFNSTCHEHVSASAIASSALSCSTSTSGSAA